MPARAIHLVGSYPSETAFAAMREAIKLVGPDLRCLADGETGDRSRWIVDMVDALRENPKLAQTKHGEWRSYDDCPRFRVLRGRSFDADSLRLGRAEAARANFTDFGGICRDAGLDLGYQVGIPGDLDLALFSFGPAAALRHRAVFREALGRTMREITDWAGARVLFQIEIPVELVEVARTPRHLQSLASRYFARGVAKLAAQAPAGSRFGVHLCVGDLNNRALARLRDANPLVNLTRAVLEQWPRSMHLDYVHLPLAAGDSPAPADPGFYSGLRRLRSVPPGVRVVAGIVHEEQPLDVQRRLLGYVEDAIGRTVDVGPACGLGRRTPEAARRALEAARELAAT